MHTFSGFCVAQALLGSLSRQQCCWDWTHRQLPGFLGRQQRCWDWTHQQLLVVGSYVEFAALIGSLSARQKIHTLGGQRRKIRSLGGRQENSVVGNQQRRQSCLQSLVCFLIMKIFWNDLQLLPAKEPVHNQLPQAAERDLLLDVSHAHFHQNQPAAMASGTSPIAQLAMPLPLQRHWGACHKTVQRTDLLADRVVAYPTPWLQQR